MAPYEKVKPKYVREWLSNKKKTWMELITSRLLNAKKSGMIPEEEKVQVKLSTKDHLRALGINVNFGDHELDDINSDGLSACGMDMDVAYLESDNEELTDQDKYKGWDLNSVPKVGRRFDTDLAHKNWLNKDVFIGIYDYTMKNKPRRKDAIETVKSFRERSLRIKKETKLNEP